MIKNNLMPFLAGIFFTLFILMVIFVVYLYNENSGLKRDLKDFQRKLSDIEIKIETPGDSVPTPQQKPTSSTETKTYYIPKPVETKPSPGPNSPYTATEAFSESQKKQIGSNEGRSETKTYLVPNQVESQLNQNTSSVKISDAPNIVEKVYQDYDPVFSQEKWDRLRVNMTKAQVKSILGNPSRIISKIDTVSYVYRFTIGEGIINFNRSMKVVDWTKP